MTISFAVIPRAASGHLGFTELCLRKGDTLVISFGKQGAVPVMVLSAGAADHACAVREVAAEEGIVCLEVPFAAHTLAEQLQVAGRPAEKLQ